MAESFLPGLLIAVAAGAYSLHMRSDESPDIGRSQFRFEEIWERAIEGTCRQAACKREDGQQLGNGMALMADPSTVGHDCVPDI